MLLSLLVALVLVWKTSSYLSPDLERVVNQNGAWTIAYGFKVDLPNANKSFLFENSCRCRNMCFMLPWCATSSLTKNANGSVECRLSNQKLHHIFLVKDNTSITFARESSYDYFFGSDGMFYTLTKTQYSCSSLTPTCNALFTPTGRGTMLKTASQLRGYMEFRTSENFVYDGSHFFMDLVPNTTAKTVKWGDGTLYTSTEISTYEKLQPTVYPPDLCYSATVLAGNLQFIGSGFYGMNSQSYLICQLNPLKRP